jgi:hypothetical protein
MSKVRRNFVVFGYGRERLYTRERAKALARKITCELLTGYRVVKSKPPTLIHVFTAPVISMIMKSW